MSLYGIGKRVIGLMFCISLWGCAALPSNVALPAASSLDASIILNPAIPLAKSEVTITCRLPVEIQNGRFTFGVSDMFMSEGSIDQPQHIRKVQLGCEPIHIFCGYQEYSKDVGWREPKGVMLDVTPAGDCSQ